MNVSSTFFLVANYSTTTCSSELNTEMPAYESIPEYMLEHCT